MLYFVIVIIIFLWINLIRLLRFFFKEGEGANKIYIVMNVRILRKLEEKL